MDATYLPYELKQGFDPNRRCNNVRWNCIDYALSNPDAHYIFEKLLRNFPDKPVSERFQKACEFLGIVTTKLDFTSALENYKNVIIFYWWEQEDRCWGFHYTDYHFLRKIDGIWMEKDGFNSVPYAFPQDQLKFIIEHYDADKKAVFSIE